MSNAKHDVDPHTPETIFPVDDLNDQFLSIDSLREMGYPVCLGLADPFDYFANNIDNPRVRWESEQYSEWIVPIVAVDGFERWSDVFATPRKIGNLATCFAVSKHPIFRLQSVTEGNPAEVYNEMINFRDSKETGTVIAFSPDIDEADILEKMFLAAYDRAQFMIDTGHPVFASNYVQFTAERGKVYQYEAVKEMLLMSGQSPLTSSEMKGLFKDYISMLEALSDKFKSFKSKTV
jgi:hypothetical protein